MTSLAFNSTAWPDEIIQLLDDHHLVVLSDSAAQRTQIVNSLRRHLEVLPDTEVIIINGTAAVDLPSFCRQLEKRMVVESTGPDPWWRDVQSLIRVLRNAPTNPKRRYFIWYEAHMMLEADVELFCRVVNGLFGVAAEAEHINSDSLVLQRVVFVGDQKLGAYAEDHQGQFCRWLDDSDDAPFWEVASVLERPPVLTYRMDG